MSAHPGRPAPSYPRLQSAQGVQIGDVKSPQSGGGGGSFPNIPLGPNGEPRIPLDRPISASGRETKGLSAYKIIKTIGRGKFGVCQLVECNETRKQYVLKCIQLADQTDRERLLALQEVETLKRLQQPKPHPFIIRYHESFLYQDALYIVMQYASGGDLHHFLRERKAMGIFLDENLILDWLIQLLLAIRRVHESHIIHRDIKSQNIFLQPSKMSAHQMAKDAAAAERAHQAAQAAGFPLGITPEASAAALNAKHSPLTFTLKLGDFGISKVLNSTGELAMSVVGTPYSMSPEVCENKPYSFKSDIWAIGCVLYELCVLKHAFDSNNLLGLVWKIVQEAYPPIPDMYSHDLRDLVSAMLAKDPAARPTVEQILDLKFIRRRLKVQIDERLRQRNLKRDRSTSSPTESTQNVFDNAMSVSGYEEVSHSGMSPPEDGFYDNEREDESEQPEGRRSRGGGDAEYSRSSVAQFSKSTLMPSRPILGLHPNLASSVSPKASPSHQSQQQQPSQSQHIRNKNSISAGNSGGGSGSKRAEELNSSGSFSGDDRQNVVLGRANKKNLISPKGRPGAFFPSSSSASSSSTTVPAGSSPGATRHLAVPNNHSSPRRDRDELAPSPSARSKEQARAQAEAARRLVNKDSFVDETGEAEDVVHEEVNSAASPHNSYPSYGARPSMSGAGAPGGRAPPPSQARSYNSYNPSPQGSVGVGAMDGMTNAEEDELAAALRDHHIRDDDDDDGDDGLGESDPDDGESSDEDLVIEQLQSQLEEAGDPNEGDSPIYFLPDSSDEEGEEEDDEGGDNAVAGRNAAPQHQKSHPPPNALAHVQRPLQGAPQKKALPALHNSIKSRAANVLSADGSSSSSSAQLLEPRAPPPQLSLRDKFEATRQRCLRSISEKAFESLYTHFQQQLQSPNAANFPQTKPGTAFQYNMPETINITNARASLKKAGIPNSEAIPGDLIFAIEQLAILQQMLDAPPKNKK